MTGENTQIIGLGSVFLSLAAALTLLMFFDKKRRWLTPKSDVAELGDRLPTVMTSLANAALS